MIENSTEHMEGDKINTKMLLILKPQNQSQTFGVDVGGYLYIP